MTTDPRRGQTSASNAQADSLCKGRHLAQRGIVEPERSADASHGDAIHQALAELPHPASIEALQGLPAFVALDPSQQELAESCLKIELQKAEFFGADWVKAKVFRETRYWVQVTPTVSHSGQVDVVYRLGPRALILDYKTLDGERPESAENLQLRDLVCLAAGTLLVNSVGVVLVQPLATHDPSTCLYEKEDIARATGEMYARVGASNDPKAPRTAGEVQCAFCLAKGKCLEYTAWAASKLPVPANLITLAIEDWTPELRTQFEDGRSGAQDWLDYCHEFNTKGAAKDPNFVPGYALKGNPPMRPITDLQVLYGRLCALRPDATPESILPDYMHCLDGTKKKIVDLIGKLTGLKGKRLANKADELFAGITGEIPKKSSLKKVKE